MKRKQSMTTLLGEAERSKAYGDKVRLYMNATISEVPSSNLIEAR